MKCTATVNEIYNIIDEFAPFSSQCEWDNSGLLVGDGMCETEKIGVVLDITPEAVEEAASLGIGLIVSHHPIIFSPLKSISSKSVPYMLAKNGICALCSHTPLDKAVGGVNDALAAALGFNARPLFSYGDEAMLRAFEIEETDGEALARLVAERLNTAVSLVDSGKKIRRVAVCGGAGGDFIPDVISAGCDAYITGEVKHNHLLEAKADGLTLLQAGHFSTENPVVDALANLLASKTKCEIVRLKQSAPDKTII